MQPLKILILALLLAVGYTISAQPFSRQDSLRGSITAERAWWDLVYYHLDIEVLPEEKKISGSNTIYYKVLESKSIMQIDLQPPLSVTNILQENIELKYTTEGNAIFIQLIAEQAVGQLRSVKVLYEGKPKEAVRAPWDGGFSWKKDGNGKHFIATSCQGLGASVWWPCKDHMYDEVDSMLISVEVPDHLINVSNGRLRELEVNSKKKTKTYHWFVSNPINNYGVNVNIGDYISWQEKYKGEKGPLDITYWALREDELKAKEQFKDVIRMFDAFEHWFGPYPFYEDGYQLVQVPYLGMEHQSSITYGNNFQQGYLGMDLSSTGWGLKFDFIIIHESGHEWFANNITHRDMADMWLHESFTNYSESLFLEYHYGKEAGQEYVRGTRTGIANQKPMIGPYGVNYKGYPGDVYPKGANMLNTLRTIVDDDERWRGLLRSLNKEFYHSTVSSADVEAYIADYLEANSTVSADKSNRKFLISFFDQYLRDSRLPILEYYFKEERLFYRWQNTIASFNMPVDVNLGDRSIRITPTSRWQNLEANESDFSVDANYYIAVLKSR